MNPERTSWQSGAAGALVALLLFVPACRSRPLDASLAVSPGLLILQPDDGAPDSVAVTGDSGHSNGVFVVGRGAHGPRQRIRHETAPVIEVGSYDSLLGPPNAQNLAAAFTKDRPMAVKVNEPWDPGAQEVTLEFRDPIVLPLKLWLVYRPTPRQRAERLRLRALHSMLTAAMIWYEERVGTRLHRDMVAFEDVSDRPGADALVNFETASDTRADLVALGHRQGAVNIYVVRSVNGDVGLGLTLPIGGDCVVLPSRAHPTLLAHELGHTFALNEADPTVFDERNVMRKDSICRKYFSEGQIFYAYFKPASAIYDVAGEPASPVSGLFGVLHEKSTPFIDMRIWDDGPPAPAGLGTTPP